MQTTTTATSKINYAKVPDVAYGSHLVRLSLREWMIVFIIVGGFLIFTPILWGVLSPFDRVNDYRIPYELSNDYWVYHRCCAAQTKEKKILLIGDSVVWGEYVLSDQTLPHFLDQTQGSALYANLGVNGTHPVALAGLTKYYGRAIRDSRVFLHFNPLWMSSPRHDLQIDKEFNFNHPRLVPQFLTRIPCYRATFSERLNAVIERYIPFLSWVNHLRAVYFKDQDLPSWTLEHPYTNPLSQFASIGNDPEDALRHKPISWEVNGKQTQSFPWVELETSLQWEAFKQTTQTLKQRGNQVFVMVGPFNEHILDESSLATYRKLKVQFEQWLKESKIAYCVPEPLPSPLYADTSHPLAEGYDLLAQRLYQTPAFKTWLSM